MAQAECITTAIRELMSRGRPPKSTSPTQAAHTEFVATLAGNIPHPIFATVDSDDLDNLFQDLSADAVGVIRNAAEKMREHENWRAS